MRLRHVAGAEQKIAESGYVIREPETCRGRWAEVFGNGHPVFLEIGMGKGQFLMSLAAAGPRINYVGIEKYSSVLLKAVRKQEAAGLGNVRFLCIDALRLAEVFAEGEASGIYLNFSDPWPKDRHAKRRLTSPRFLQVYERILAPGGTIEFKTDNLPLFEYSLRSISSRGWRITAETRDLRTSSFAADNIMTEYEERFAAEGKPICKLVAVRP